MPSPPLFFSLLALGLKHFEGTEFPKPLISKYLLPTKTAHQLTVRIKNLNMNRAPDNIIRVSDAFGSLFWGLLRLSWHLSDLPLSVFVPSTFLCTSRHFLKRTCQFLLAMRIYLRNPYSQYFECYFDSLEPSACTKSRYNCGFSNADNSYK